MLREFIVSIRFALITIVLTGIIYPLFMTLLGGTVFPHQAEGSLVKDEKGKVVGSRLIGQPFADPAYFQPRPSAAGNGYDALASSGSNYGPTSKKLRERAEADIARLRKENPDARGLIPAELVAASASGLDPHISPQAAKWQAPRVAKARGVALDRVLAIVESVTEGRELGFLGEPRVNVLELNLALNRRFGTPVLAPKE